MRVMKTGLAAVSVFAVSACSLGPSDSVKVRLSMEGVGEPASVAASTMGTAEPMVDLHTPPETVDGFSCFIVNVSGRGIPSLGHGNDSRYLWDGEDCNDPGVVSEIVTSADGEIELEVPAGDGRLVQVIGLRTADGSCPAGMPFEDIYHYWDGDSSDGTMDYRLHLLGEADVDLHADQTVEVHNIYDPMKDGWPFRCRAGENLDYSTLGNLVMWLDGLSLPFDDGVSIEYWYDSSAYGHDVSNAIYPTVTTSHPSGIPMVDFTPSSSLLGIGATPAMTSEVYTIFAVVSTPTVTEVATKYIVNMENDQNVPYLTWDSPDGTTAEIVWNDIDETYTPVTVSHAVMDTGEDVIVSGVRTSSGIRLRVNGLQTDSNAQMIGLGSHVGTQIGNDGYDSGGFTGGLVGEVLIYTDEMPIENIEAVECQLSQHWGIGIATPCD